MLTSIQFTDRISIRLNSINKKQVFNFDKYQPQMLNWRLFSETLHTIVPISESNSMLHCLATAFDDVYLLGKSDNIGLDKKESIRNYRQYLSQLLQQVNDGISIYEQLFNGQAVELSEENPNLSLSNMVGLLQSDDPITLDYLEFIANIIECDIYVLNFETGSLLNNSPIKNRRSVILLYIDHSYHLVYVRREQCGQFVFSGDDSLIMELQAFIQKT